MTVKEFLEKSEFYEVYVKFIDKDFNVNICYLDFSKKKPNRFIEYFADWEIQRFSPYKIQGVMLLIKKA